MKLGPKYIPDNPHLAHKRMKNEIDVVMRKVNKISGEHGWTIPSQRCEFFKASLTNILTSCHDRYPSSDHLKIIKNLERKFEATKTIIRKTDKSKVFHLGTTDDHILKARTYMTRTDAYQDLEGINPLDSLVKRANEFLYALWVNKHITQKHYENLKIQREEAELAHLYFLPKAHKPQTPLRPIVAGMKSPTIGISKWLDGLLRPLFNQLACDTAIENGTQLIKSVERWSDNYLTPSTTFISMDVTDLYTMIPQEGGVIAIKRLLEEHNLKQIDGIKKEIVLALTRFVITNNYFYFDGSYYKQIRGGAMGSPLTLTIANTYMYFVERPIAKWAHRTFSLYYRYIDDLFIMSNISEEILEGLVKFWNRLDKNIVFSESIGKNVQYLDVNFENRGGELISKVYHKPSHELYFLPFSSIHAQHIKRNIPFGALVRAMRYSSSYDDYKLEEAHICMSLLLNRYPLNFILKQFERVSQVFHCAVPTQENFLRIRRTFLNNTRNEIIQKKIDFEVNIMCHFSFCKGMSDFATSFHKLWNECFSDTPIGSRKPIVGSRRLDNLLDYLVHKKPNKLFLK